jgi:hypothetical protein
MQTRKLLLALMAFALLILSACADAGDPAETVQAYLQAKIDGDREALSTRLCAEMESLLDNEARSFSTVTEARLEDAVCTYIAEGNTVSCTGAIVATYGTEATRFDLSNYRVVQEDGEWKWCGEAG